MPHTEPLLTPLNRINHSDAICYAEAYAHALHATSPEALLDAAIERVQDAQAVPLEGSTAQRIVRTRRIAQAFLVVHGIQAAIDTRAGRTPRERIVIIPLPGTVRS